MNLQESLPAAQRSSHGGTHQAACWPRACACILECEAGRTPVSRTSPRAGHHAAHRSGVRATSPKCSRAHRCRTRRRSFSGQTPSKKWVTVKPVLSMRCCRSQVPRRPMMQSSRRATADRGLDPPWASSSSSSSGAPGCVEFAEAIGLQDSLKWFASEEAVAPAEAVASAEADAPLASAHPSRPIGTARACVCILERLPPTGCSPRR
jgi:hypothetical protein